MVAHTTLLEISCHGSNSIYLIYIYRPPDKSVIENILFLFLNQNVCYGYSKETSQRDGSIEHSKHVFKLLGTKIITLRSKFCLFGPICIYVSILFKSSSMKNKHRDRLTKRSISLNQHWHNVKGEISTYGRVVYRLTI